MNVNLIQVLRDLHCLKTKKAAAALCRRRSHLASCKRCHV